MAVKVERLPNEPVIVVTLSGDLNAQIVQDMFDKSAQFMDEIDGRVYRITDIRATEISFPDLVQVLSRSTSGQPGSSSDPRICGVLVGTHGWSRFFSESLQQAQYGHLNIPIFEAIDDAMAYIREQIALA